MAMTAESGNEELQRYAAELERSNTELAYLAAVASHDLSDPLRTITGLMQLLDQHYGAQLDDRGRTFIAHALDGAQRMQRLIDGLLAYAKVASVPAPEGRVDLAAVARAAIRALDARIVETDATIELGRLPVVRGDADQLDQALCNLLSNALKFTRPGDSPHVAIDARRDGDAWCVAVVDRGIGIPPQAREQVFQLFHRLHGVDAYEGTGMGLAIVKRIAERHGGSVRVETTPGGGATVLLMLPA